MTIRLRAAAAPLVVDTAIGTSDPQREPPSTVDTTPATILVVDDEPLLRAIQERMLRKIGMNVLTARDGTEAIALLSRTRCDIVVTDIRMPGDVDGMALYQWIKREQPGLADRCLFVTGDIGEWAADPSLGVHPDRVLGKPFVRDEYITRIQTMLDRSPLLSPEVTI